MEKVRKYKIIKKLLIPILALAIFLLPISPSLNLNKDGQLLAMGVKTNTAEAAFKDDFTATVTPSNVTSGSVDIGITLQSTRNGAYWDYMNAMQILSGSGNSLPSSFQIMLSEKADFSTYVDYENPTWGDLGYGNGSIIGNGNANMDLGSIQDTAGFKVNLKKTFGGLNPEKTYYARFYMKVESGNYINISNPTAAEFKTLKAGTGDTPKDTTTISNQDNWDFGCLDLTHFSLTGCVAAFVYYVFYTVAAMVAHLAGIFLDFLIYYSTNSSSYTNGFITKGWGAIRDVANIFFIIALLYIAIKTILSLNTTNNKKLISYIVIVALLINFSLFFTEVIIDGSNILAKVFYNNIDSKYENKTPAVGAEGEKSISIGLIDKFNPQQIVSKDVYDQSPGQFIFITLLATAIILFTAYVFFVVGLLFVGRVVMLWLSMIFAPIAFASYTLPFDIPGLGHKEWWKNLLENAFMAPLFIFMLYIIVMFTGFLSEIVKYPDSAKLAQKTMSIVIPFIILAVLLMKAKEMAVKYSGELGTALAKVGKMIGGTVVGAAVGGGALLAGTAGRATLGRVGSAIANSEKAKEWERKGYFGAKTLNTIAGKTGKASFDARAIKIGGKTLGTATGLSVGKAQEGGFEKARADKTAKRMKRAKELEAGPDSQLVKDVRKVEIDHQDLVGKYAGEIERLDKTIEKKQKIMSDAGIYARAHKDEDDAQEKFKEAADDWEGAKNNKNKLREGKVWKDSTGADMGPAISSGGFSMKKLEDDELPRVQNALKLHNFETRKEYVETLNSGWNKVANAISSGGTHSETGLAEASHKIRMDIKLDSGTKTS